MAEPVHNDKQIIDAWHDNAAPWTAAVRAGQIASRRLATDRAIVQAVTERRPRRVLDIGCGEGWLARALAADTIAVTGVDVVPALIAQAQQAGGGEFRVMSYEDIAAGQLHIRVDTVVCNFSLLGAGAVENLCAALPALLNPHGALIVQTLHPLLVCGDVPYRDGWRDGSWAGCGSGFAKPAPWYFRTLESWTTLLTDSGFRLAELREPLHPDTGKPASIIFIAEVA